MQSTRAGRKQYNSPQCMLVHYPDVIARWQHRTPFNYRAITIDVCHFLSDCFLNCLHTFIHWFLYMYRIRLYQASGLLDHWIRCEKPKFKCLGFGPVTRVSSPATMRHFYGSFILVTTGVCLAAVTLLAENLLHR